MRLNLLGKSWQYVEHRFANYHAKDGTQGQCDSPTKVGKTIRVDPRLEGVERLEVDIHELWHACHWEHDEEHVERVARDIARALYRIGYRLEK